MAGDFGFLARQRGGVWSVYPVDHEFNVRDLVVLDEEQFVATPWRGSPRLWDGTRFQETSAAFQINTLSLSDGGVVGAGVDGRVGRLMSQIWSSADAGTIQSFVDSATAPSGDTSLVAAQGVVATLGQGGITISTLPSRADLVSVAVDTAGGEWVGSLDGEVFRKANGTWHSVGPKAPTTVSAMCATGASIARGSGGLGLSWWQHKTNGVIEVSDGGLWLNLAAAIPGVSDFSCDDRGLVAAGTFGVVLAVVDGGISTLAGSLTPRDVNGLSDGRGGLGPRWAVGEKGLVLEKTDAGTWREHVAVTSEDLNAVAESDGGAWAVGAKGTILRWNGVDWAVVPSSVSASLSDVAVVGSEVWAVGATGTVIRSVGGSFSVVPFPSNVFLRRLAFFGPNQVWVVGNNSTSALWSGTAWTVHPVPFAGPAIVGIAGDSGGARWLLALPGVLYEWSNGGWKFAKSVGRDVSAMASGADGSLWMLSLNSLIRVKNGQTREFLIPSHVPMFDLTVDGSVWVGGGGGAILRFF